MPRENLHGTCNTYTMVEYSDMIGYQAQIQR